ncbi:hypothetical protein [Parasphaerochaeta coccoides]|uniref:Uncharacterized protein n=1 Tax=Parasphaerochaeta coccoides (strain ATCC BAA-1237 / DSM 17374 / SPN1) TaxID=760011 RepID=F4GII1_PARC1|nr:hypothetical protein [Parasphaerochaeta coccoides]AEC01689.1 hypothetical protein Spico_0461 [Parasphaerochaeta coccoides DSM 17374]
MEREHGFLTDCGLYECLYGAMHGLSCMTRKIDYSCYRTGITVTSATHGHHGEGHMLRLSFRLPYFMKSGANREKEVGKQEPQNMRDIRSQFFPLSARDVLRPDDITISLIIGRSVTILSLE